MRHLQTIDYNTSKSIDLMERHKRLTAYGFVYEYKVGGGELCHQKLSLRDLNITALPLCLAGCVQTRHGSTKGEKWLQ